jgi:hypothetical protein
MPEQRGESGPAGRACLLRLPSDTTVHLQIRSCARALAVATALALLAPAPSDAAETPISRMTFARGWATFGLVLPPQSARTAVQVGTFPTQTDVKVRWPDGSIRFAVVSTKIGAAGTYGITASNAAPGGATGATPPQASVQLTIQGRPFTAAALPTARGDAWLSGPLVSEQRSIVAPGMHPFLRVIFDVRTYADGAARVDVTVENCLDTDAADEVAYDVAVTVNRRPAFQQFNVRHKYLARWRKVFATGGLLDAAVTPDLGSAVAVEALPAFLPTVARPVRSLSGGGISGTGFEILGFGDLTLPMDAHGGRPELAPYPDWTTEYLVHKAPAQRDYMLRHGELAGSWGVHVRNPDGSMPSLDAPGQGYYWLDPRWRDPGNMSGGFRGPRGRLDHRAQPGDIAHQPSLAYVPYLLTGDRFFADELAFWANFCLIGSFASDDNRKGAQGLLIGNEVRGIGWGLRNLGDAAAYLPDDNPMKRYLASKVWNNLTYLDQYGASFDSGPVQSIFPGRRPEDTATRYQPYMWISLWEQSYVAWAIDHVMAHGPVAGYNFATGGAKLRNRIARLQLALFTSPAWPKAPDRQAPYLLAVGKWTAGSPPRVEYFRTLAEVATATFSVPTPAAPDFVRPFEGYYGPEARLMVMICRRLGDAGADAALAAVMADSKDGVSMIADLNRRAGWAIAPPVLPQ